MTFFFYTLLHIYVLLCSMVVDIDHFLRCDNALPAAALALSLYRLSLRILEATLATRLLVRPEPLAIALHLLSSYALSIPLPRIDSFGLGTSSPTVTYSSTYLIPSANPLYSGCSTDGNSPHGHDTHLPSLSKDTTNSRYNHRLPGIIHKIYRLLFHVALHVVDSPVFRESIPFKKALL